MLKTRKNLSLLTLSEIQERGLEGELNKPRTSKPGPGRPRKINDKRNQFSLSFWFQLMQKDYNKLRPIQRTRIALDCWKTLIHKANSIPSDPGESKINADETLTLLQGIEEKRIDINLPKESVEQLKEPSMVRPNNGALRGSEGFPARETEKNEKEKLGSE